MDNILLLLLGDYAYLYHFRWNYGGGGEVSGHLIPQILRGAHPLEFSVQGVSKTKVLLGKPS